jgi:hypothetical protein
MHSTGTDGVGVGRLATVGHLLSGNITLRVVVGRSEQTNTAP